jgi:ABC-type Fe3+ transport system permease subunit
MQYRSSPCGRLAVLLLVPCVFAPSPGRCLACMTYSTAQHSTVKYNTVQYSSTSFAAGLAASRGVWVVRMCVGYAVVEKPFSRARDTASAHESSLPPRQLQYRSAVQWASCRVSFCLVQ